MKYKSLRSARRLKILVFSLLLFTIALDAKEKLFLPKNTPEAMRKPYVVLVSIDGFRHDYVTDFTHHF